MAHPSETFIIYETNNYLMNQTAFFKIYDLTTL